MCEMSIDIRCLSIDKKSRGGDVLKDLLKEYKESLRLTKRMREEAPEEDQKIYASMITNLEDAVKWLRDNQEPRSKKSRLVVFREAGTFERIGSIDFFNPFAQNVYTVVENMVDAERESLQ